MEVPEGVLGADQDTLRLVSDADDTPGLPGAQGGSPALVHSSVTVMVTVIVVVSLSGAVAVTCTSAWWSARVS